MRDQIRHRCLYLFPNEGVRFEFGLVRTPDSWFTVKYEDGEETLVSTEEGIQLDVQSVGMKKEELTDDVHLELLEWGVEESSRLFAGCDSETYNLRVESGSC